MDGAPSGEGATGLGYGLMTETVLAKESASSLTADGSVGTPSDLVGVLIAVAAVIFLLPLMLVIAGLVWAADGGSPVFAHRRIGRGGRVFYCLKFRTMATDAESRLQTLLSSDPIARRQWEEEQKLRNDPRVTPIGEFLRKSSLDELPQLINVIRGEMSLVGPRPIVAAEVPRYGPHFKRYCSVRPGITGLWQVSGRSDVSYRQRVVMDVAYVRSRSLALDMKILLQTIPAVLQRRGAI